MYSCTCSDCKHEPEPLNLAINPKFKKLLKTVETAFKTLHKRGNYKPEDLDQVPEYKKLISDTSGILNRVFDDNDISQGMLKSLQKDTFLFSALKTNAQLQEASRLLLTDDKKIKSFNQFSNDVSKIKKNYNENYLEAEYDFALGSVQMAERWENFSDGDRYYLQYRTAADDKVRQSHEVLHDTTLPKTHAFWDLFFPPNGWRCRCTVLQVLAALNKLSNGKKAIEKGEIATTKIGKNGSNKLAIFRFNAGKQKIVFPPKHPYNKVKGAKTVKANIDQKTRENDYKILSKNKLFKNEKEKVVEREIHTIYKQLTQEETAAIHMYTLPDAYFDYLNSYNRTGNVSMSAKKNGFNKETLDAMTRVVSKGLDNIPDKHKGLVYRGTYLNKQQFKAYEDALNNKTPHIEKGFLSTTKEKKKAFDGNTSYVIKSKNGAYIDEIAAISEEEVLFKPKQEFKVTKIEKGAGKNIIYMEEI